MPTNTKKWVKPKEIEPQHKEILATIGKKLEKIRKNKNLTAKGIHTEIGISRNAYRQMEKGEIYFSTYNFLKILDFYSIDLPTLIKTEIENL